MIKYTNNGETFTESELIQNFLNIHSNWFLDEANYLFGPQTIIDSYSVISQYLAAVDDESLLHGDIYLESGKNKETYVLHKFIEYYYDCEFEKVKE